MGTHSDLERSLKESMLHPINHKYFLSIYCNSGMSSVSQNWPFMGKDRHEWNNHGNRCKITAEISKWRGGKFQGHLIQPVQSGSLHWGSKDRRQFGLVTTQWWGTRKGEETRPPYWCPVGLWGCAEGRQDSGISGNTENQDSLHSDLCERHIQGISG